MSDFEYASEFAEHLRINEVITILDEVPEDILLDRKKALYALRTGDENQRCSGDIFRGDDRQCALGQIMLGLGYERRDDNAVFHETEKRLGMSSLSSVWAMNDSGDFEDSGSNCVPLDDDPALYHYTWNDIADNLAALWGLE